ncbi:MAG: hypothetical protein ACYCVV_19845 [Acidimicrobiales bacterium]
MGRKATITREKIDTAARLVRHSWPRGIGRGAIAEELHVNVNTWRTGGYEDLLLSRYQDIHRDRGLFYNDPDETAFIVDLRYAVSVGDTTRADELRARWEALHTPVRGQRTLDLEADGGEP